MHLIKVKNEVYLYIMRNMFDMLFKVKKVRFIIFVMGVVIILFIKGGFQSSYVWQQRHVTTNLSLIEENKILQKKVLDLHTKNSNREILTQ